MAVVVGRGGREEGTTWFKKGKMDRDLVFNLLYTIPIHKNTYTSRKRSSIISRANVTEIRL